MPILTIAATYGILKIIPPRYQATASVLMFDPQLIDAGNLGQSGPVRNIDTVAVNTEIAVMLSETALLDIAKELKLGEDPEFQFKIRLGNEFCYPDPDCAGECRDYEYDPWDQC